MTRAERQLALAASSQKIGFAFLIGCKVVDWGVARKASKDVDAAFAQAIAWIDYYLPGRAFIESIDAGTRKGKHSIALVHALAAAATDRNIEIVRVPRRTRYPNKYEEAAALAEKHPQLCPWVPKSHRDWESEPHRMIVFEAVSLAEEWCETNQAT